LIKTGCKITIIARKAAKILVKSMEKEGK
jgi:hypothetical protein